MTDQDYESAAWHQYELECRRMVEEMRAGFDELDEQEERTDTAYLEYVRRHI